MIIAERLQEMVADIQAAVTASELQDKELITVTYDGREAATAKSPRAGAIIVRPRPAETMPAGRTQRLTWEISLLADDDDPLDVLTRLEAFKGLLRGLRLYLAPDDTCAPTDFEKTDRTTIPGYTITHIEEHRS